MEMQLIQTPFLIKIKRWIKNCQWKCLTPKQATTKMKFNEPKP